MPSVRQLSSAKTIRRVQAPKATRYSSRCLCERRLLVNPVLLRVAHSAAAGYCARGPGAVKAAGKRTVTESLGSEAAPTRIQLIDDHVCGELVILAEDRAIEQTC
jgi:hypothetical protein